MIVYHSVGVCSWFLSFFFFQAEDGIRDLTVTGVQTCALPIYVATRAVAGASGAKRGADHHGQSQTGTPPSVHPPGFLTSRNVPSPPSTLPPPRLHERGD